MVWESVQGPTMSMSIQPGLWNWVAFCVFQAFGFLPAWGATTNEQGVARMYSSGRFTTGDGLPQNSVTSITQTPDGFLWVGTLRGLARFDGCEFVLMNSEKLPGMLSQGVSALASVPDGSLWIGFTRGLCRMDPGRGHCIPESQLEGFHCTALCVQDSKVVVGGPWGLAWGHSGGVRRIHSGLDVRAMAATEDSPIWISTGQGIYRWNPQQEGSIPARLIQGAGGNGLVIDGNSLWASVDASLYEIDARSGTVRRCFNGLGVTPVAVDHFGRLWLVRGGTRGRVGLFEPDEGVFVAVYPVQETSHQEFRRGHVDSSGTIWMGSSSEGMVWLRSKAVRVIAEPEGLPSGDVWSVHADPLGMLWIQTALGTVGRMGDRFERLPGQQSYQGRSVLAEGPESAVVAGNGLWRADFRLQGLRQEHAGGQFSSLGRARSGQIVACGEAGIWQRDEMGNWHSMPGPKAGVRWICWEEGLDGDVFLGSIGEGLWCRHRGLNWEPVSLAGSPAAAAVMWWQDGNRPWVGSTTGLYRRRDDGTWDRWTTRDGLIEDLVLGMQPDGRGGLWLLGHRGISRVGVSNLLDVASGRASRVWPRVIGDREGLGAAEGNSGFPSTAREADGTLWFATTRGAVRLDPKELSELHPPQPQLVEVYDVGAGPTAPSTPLHRPAIFKSGAGRALRFRFTAPAPSEGYRVHLEHWLHGVDAGWVNADRRREAFYAGLKPGRYLFEVRASTEDGIWHPENAGWSFEVRPMWWERGEILFGGLSVGIVGGLVLLRRRMSVQREILELRQSRAIKEERRRIVRDMHDGLGSELARVNMAAATGPVDVGAASRKMLEKLQTLVWLTDPEEDRLDSLTRALASRVEGFFPQGAQAVQLELPEILPEVRLDGHWRRELLAWLDEGMANVAKHSSAQNVRFGIRVEKDGLILVLADDGIGFDPHVALALGRGLANQRERILRLGGTVELQSAPGRGTFLQARLPVMGLAHHQA